MLKEEGEVIYASERFKCKSTVLARVLNIFGESRGFEKILEIIRNPETSLQFVHDLVQCI
jgi:hypothetical protein